MKDNGRTSSTFMLFVERAKVLSVVVHSLTYNTDQITNTKTNTMVVLFLMDIISASLVKIDLVRIEMVRG